MIETPQQLAVIDWFRSGTGDLCVTARAGSGKTWTMLAGVMARPTNTSATVCAFNKRISDDHTERLRGLGAGSLARSKTLHALGFRAVSRAFNRAGRRLDVNKHREMKIALEILGGDDSHEDEARTIGKLAALAKETRPDDITADTLRDLALDFGLADSDDDEVDTYDVAVERAGVALQVVERSLTIGAEVSYADMLWLPLVKKWSPDQTDLVCVDEAQDMGLAQLRLAAMVRRSGGRVVVIGDDRQAIYSWRGAAPGSLERVASGLRAKRLALTVTFRCGLAIVAEARKIVPDLQAAPGAAAGTVRNAPEAELLAHAQPGDFVLSRTNAPLAAICLSLIRAGIPARIVGSDLGPELIKLVRRMARGGSSGDEVADLLARLVAWRDREIRRAVVAKRQERADSVSDQAATIIALAVDVDTVHALLAVIDRVFDDSDKRHRVMCSTIHRAKGLEADRVWILADTLDQIRPRSDIQEIEEANLRYVAITRARRELVYVR